MIDRGCPDHFDQFFIQLHLADAHPMADHQKHLQDFGDLLLCQQINLQIELISLVGFVLHPVLLHEDEGAQQNSLHRNRHGKENERIGIELGNPWNEPGIDQKPGGKPKNMKNDESDASRKSGNRVGYPIKKVSLLFEMSFYFGSTLNIGFHRIVLWRLELRYILSMRQEPSVPTALSHSCSNFHNQKTIGSGAFVKRTPSNGPSAFLTSNVKTL